MSAPLCVVAGAGRLAAGYVAPLLAAAGWHVVLACRSDAALAAVCAGGIRVHRVGGGGGPVAGVGAVHCDDPALGGLVAAADLVATSVGPGSLPAVGRLLAPLLRRRLDERRAPLNVLTVENHRRAPELLAGGMFAADPSLAAAIGTRLGVAGTAAWCVVSRRELGPAGLVLHSDGVEEAYVDGAALVPGVPPLDGSVPGPVPVAPFDTWMTEKLWVFNGGHAAAAYAGARHGCATVHEALAVPEIRQLVRAVVVESLAAVRTSRRDPDAIMARFADPALADPVERVAREPRRKLAPGDRLLGPAVAALGAGRRPVALARAAADALAYHDPGDAQARTLATELALVGPAEVLETVGRLAPRDELSRMICHEYRSLPVGAGR